MTRFGMILFAILVASPSNAQRLYDASLGTLPEAQGWTYANENANPSPFVSGGALQENTSAGGQYWFSSDPSIDFSQHVVIEAKLHILSSNYLANVGTGTREGYYLGSSDSLHSYSVGLADTGYN